MKSKDTIFFQSDTGYLIRTGLTIYSLPKKLSSKGNKSRFTHLSLQQNLTFKIIKRGMPKLYNYNLNPNLKHNNDFDEILLENLKKLYETPKIPVINIKQIKIKSKVSFQISYDKENNGWIVNDNLGNCVIFTEINEIDTLYLDNKITKNMFQICKECYELFRNLLKKKVSLNNNINHNFLHEISENTFLGYYLEDKDEVLFYAIVSNLQYNMEQFCLPIKNVEDICFKFGLPYEKSTILKTDLVTFDQIKQELKYIYNRISENYCSFQSYGSIVLVEQDNEIVTGFKILNQEMLILRKMRCIKFNNNSNDFANNDNANKNNNTIKEEEENENENINYNLTMNLKSNRTKIEENLISSDKINILMNEISQYQLPRCSHIYCKLFNELSEDDTFQKCLEKLEEIAKENVQLGLCNCNKEKNKMNLTSINLLSCLIPKDNLYNYNIERMGAYLNRDNNDANNNENSLVNKNVKSQTFFDKNNSRATIFSLNNHSSKIKKVILEKKQTIIKKNKKRVKFVDEVYNKSLIEEILVKSFKNYNVKNNFTYGEDNNNYKSDKKSVCCLIF